jgi:hypothetical protein
MNYGRPANSTLRAEPVKPQLQSQVIEKPAQNGTAKQPVPVVPQELPKDDDPFSDVSKVF